MGFFQGTSQKIMVVKPFSLYCNLYNVEVFLIPILSNTGVYKNRVNALKKKNTHTLLSASGGDLVATER